MGWVVFTIPMTFLARVLRYLFWVIVISWSVSLLRRLVSRMGEAGTAANQSEVPDLPSQELGQKLVRDPVCGMHLAERLAIVEQRSSGPVYFCSEKCREEYFGETRKFVANA